MAISDYLDKEKYLSQFFEEVEPTQFYRELFPAGSFEEQGKEQGKPNGIVAYEHTGKVRTALFFDDHLRLWDSIRDAEFSFLAPVSYFGKRRTSENARFLYAITFDLDGVGKEQIINLFFQFGNEVQPKPTFTVNSGNGLHLYYQLEKPVPMYPQVQQRLNDFKHELTSLLWNPYTSTLKKKQYQSVMQGFRVVGSQTKFGTLVRAYRTGDPVSLEYLNKWVYDKTKKIDDIAYKSDLPLAEAKAKYPEWYQRRIVEGKPAGSWKVKRALYDWWKRKIREGASYGHRYWCIWALAVYAQKCGITKKELRQDAEALIPYLSALNPAEVFTFDDLKSALKVYDKPYTKVTRQEISDETAIPIEKNKRNGRKQKEHILIMNKMRELKIQFGETSPDWYKLGGRKSAEQIVLAFREKYPNAKYSDFEKATGLKKSVFYKYR